MKKMNKKGFTLVEMLVVIAIIAILVAILVPTVTSATTKAAAATNAANLRSYKAELSIAYLTATSDSKTTELDAVTKPTSKKCGEVASGESAAYKLDGDKITVYFKNESYGINYFAGLAGSAS